MSAGETPKPRRRRWPRVLAWIGAVLGVLIAGGAVALGVMHEPLPRGRPGPAADELAHRIERAVDRTAWDRTGAVRFTFRDRDEHLWDRRRELSRVRWGEVEVLQRLDRREGIAFEGGRRVEGERARELVDRAWALFCNDTFWLNPFVKMFDPGVRRAVVRDGREDALLITYTSGGVTPGDSYLWIPGAHDLPRAGRMWVSIFPIGGVRTVFEHWVTLSTGAKIATHHTIGPADVDLGHVAGAATLAELEPGADPFAALLR